MLGSVAVALVSQGREIGKQLHSLSPFVILAALVPGLAGLYATMLSWRAVLTDLGSPLPLLPASRIFFLGQLGKYVPGSVWPVMAQMELGRDYSVGRGRTATAGVLTLAIGLTSGLVVAIALSPLHGLHGHARLLVALLLPLLVVLHPRVLSAGLDRGLRLLRRPTLERPLSWSGLLAALGWFAVSWLCFGGQLWVLARGLGSDPPGGGFRLLLLATGAFAVAWVFGFIVLVAPAGVGAREAALVLALSPALSRVSATLVAVLSRLLLTVGDALLAAAGGALHPRRKRAREVPGTCPD